MDTDASYGRVSNHSYIEGATPPYTKSCKILHKVLYYINNGAICMNRHYGMFSPS